jgi:hypothetical protein
VAISVANQLEKFFGRIGSRGFGESRSAELPAVVVRAANQNFFPGLRVRRRKSVTISEPVDFFRRQLVKKSLGQVAEKRVAQTVDALEMFKQKNELLEMRRFKFAVNAVQRMRHGVRDLCSLKVTLQIKDVLWNPLDVAMLLF